MKNLYVYFLMLSFYINGYTQQSAYPAVEFSTLNFIAAEGDNIISVGTCDKAMYSRDGGQSWNTFALDVDVFDMALMPNANGEKALLINRDNLYILDINDESVTTTTITSSGLVGGLFQKIAVNKDKIVLVASISVFVGDPSDLTFTKVGDIEYNSSDRIRDLSVTDNYSYVAMKEGKVFKCDLDAKNIETVYEFDREIRTLAMGTDDIGYVGFSSNDSPEKTIDGGANWTAFGSFSEVATFHAFGESVIISQNTNRILVSTDGGQSSEYIPYDPESSHSYMNDAYFDHDGKMYMCGQSNTLLSSEDFGLTHDNLNPYPRASFTGIDINENGHGVAVGGNGILITTSDNGETWNQLDIPAQFVSYIDGCLVTDANDIYFYNENGIMKVDQGIVSQISDESLRVMFYNDEQDYFLGFKNQGGSWVVRKSIDGGVNWENKAVLAGFSYRMDHTAAGMVLVGVDDLTYALSRDHGDTWEIVAHDFGSSIATVALYEDKVALLTAGNVIYKSSDNLETWEPVSQGYGQWYTKIYDEDHYIFTSAQNFVTTVKESKDGGETWTIVDSYCAQTNSTDLVGDRFWMGQRGGHLNYTTLDLSTSTKEPSKIDDILVQNVIQRGNDIMLVQPFNTEIEGVIYDQMGRIVQVVSLLPFIRSIKVDDLPVGIHFITFRIGNQSITEKLIII